MVVVVVSVVVLVVATAVVVVVVEDAVVVMVVVLNLLPIFSAASATHSTEADPARHCLVGSRLAAHKLSTISRRYLHAGNGSLGLRFP